jgi:hypothetical protein
MTDGSVFNQDNRKGDIDGMLTGYPLELREAVRAFAEERMAEFKAQDVGDGQQQATHYIEMISVCMGELQAYQGRPGGLGAALERLCSLDAFDIHVSTGHDREEGRVLSKVQLAFRDPGDAVSVTGEGVTAHEALYNALHLARIHLIGETRPQNELPW